MKNTLSFQKNLKQYSALAGVAMAALPKISEGQVIYTDLGPDNQMGYYFNKNMNYALDLNNDGIADFNFKVEMTYNGTSSSFPQKTYYDFAFLKPSGKNKIMFFNPFPSSSSTSSSPSSSFNLTALALNSPIGPKQQFLNSTCIFSESTTNYASWDKKTAFVGLTLESNGDVYYGWARVLVDRNPKLTIFDYAFNKTPNEEILAGSKGCDDPPALNPVTVTDNVLHSGRDGNIQWYKDGQPLNGANQESFNPSSPGNYSYLVTTDEGCHVMVPALYLLTTDAKSEKTSDAKLKIKNTLVSNQLGVTLSGPNTGEGLTVKIYNPFGQEVYSGVPSTVNQNKLMINVSSLANGIYFFQLINAGSSEKYPVEKFIVQR